MNAIWELVMWFVIGGFIAFFSAVVALFLVLHFHLDPEWLCPIFLALGLSLLLAVVLPERKKGRLML